MYYFCTYFDSNYFYRGLALYNSIANKLAENDFIMWVLCLDDLTYDTLNVLNLRGLKPIRLIDFEAGDDSLLRAKSNRTIIEYYWTITPSLLLYIFGMADDVDVLIYLDSDMFLFSSPDQIIKELGSKSILITPHDYSEEYQGVEAAGIYNVGLMGFKNNEDSIECLKWWRQRCIEWCYNRMEEGKIGDQGYLNDWPERFDNVTVCNNKGMSLAPWNITKYNIHKNHIGQLLINDTPLCCYHFHQVTFINNMFCRLMSPRIELDKTMKELIYLPYIKEIILLSHKLKECDIGLPGKVDIKLMSMLVRDIYQKGPVRAFNNFMYINF